MAALALAAALQLAPTQAAAQAPGASFGQGYSANAGKPVNIEADVLEIDDRKKTAIFKGNVSATQGDVNMKSNEIVVTYAGTGGKTPSGAGSKTASAATSDAAPPASPFGGGGEITLIDAKGNVVVTMTPAKEGEKIRQAKSDWAIFDVKKQQVTMGGGEVVLLEGDNVLKGSKLVADLTTGVSRFENPGGANGKSGRVGLIFTPPPKDKDKDGKDAKSEKKPAQ
jgi:lipopolysaccharide export system protein LptA